VKIILDTDVLLSAILFSGPPAQILKAWRDGRLQLGLSREVLAEYQKAGECLAGQFPGLDLRPLLDMIQDKAEMFSVQSLLAPICADAENDKFLACALAAKSKVIVSEDKHLLKVSGSQGIKVLKPREFLGMLQAPPAKADHQPAADRAKPDPLPSLSLFEDK